MNGREQIGVLCWVCALGAILGCSADGPSRSDRPPFTQGAANPSSTTGAPSAPSADPEPALNANEGAGEAAASNVAIPAEMAAGDSTSPSTAGAAESDADEGTGVDMVMPSSPPTTTLPPPAFSSDRTEFGLGGDSLCATGAFDLCESFEGTAVGAEAPAGFAPDGYGARTLAVVDDDSARGRRSLRIDVDANQGAVVGMLVRTDLGALGVRHFGRSFMKIQAPVPTTFVHWDAFEGRGSFGGQTNLVRWASTGTGVGTAPENWSWIYNVQSTDHGEFGSEGSRSAHPVAETWMCLEWLIDATSQEARFFQDGAEVEYLHIDSERTEIPVFDSLRFGFQKFQQSAAFRVWVDEIAIGGDRIGCNR
jgi:hypothetical protein